MLKQFAPSIVQTAAIVGIIAVHVNKSKKVVAAQREGEIRMDDAKKKILRSGAISAGAVLATVPVTMMAYKYIAKKAAEAAVSVVTEVI